ncbi:hypothetical protein HQ35_05120 [Porphyromonas cangingivalis]|uniref:Uncharacterized protein n=1 Tax=Porphyromonas cangingivalis TaxID=36874 RepID=A0A0A2EP95_PORCN|nr:hypothetical protein HQ35_05120 [Porphyromonas cangingivalis]
MALLSYPLLSIKGQDAKPTKQAFQVAVILGNSHSTDWGWRRTSDSTFTYDKEIGLTAHFRTIKIKEDKKAHGGLEFKTIDDLLRDEDFTEIRTYKDLHKRLPTLFLSIRDRVKEEGYLYKVMDWRIERTSPPVEPVYFFINKTPIKQKDYSEEWIFMWLSKDPQDVSFIMEHKKEFRPSKVYEFKKRPHSTKIISREDLKNYKLTHPGQLWSTFKSDATFIRSSYYYPVVYLIEQRGNNTCYVSEVESWYIMYPPPPPPPIICEFTL